MVVLPGGDVVLAAYGALTSVRRLVEVVVETSGNLDALSRQPCALDAAASGGTSDNLRTTEVPAPRQLVRLVDARIQT